MPSRIVDYASMLAWNPRLFVRKAYGRLLIEAVPAPSGIAAITVGGHVIETNPSRNKWWKAMYHRCCDPEIADSIHRHLAPGGVFVDVGASVGYFSALAAGIVGPSGQVHAFEPHPPTAEALRKAIASNPHSVIRMSERALGEDDAIHDYLLRRHDAHTEVSMIDDVIDHSIADEVLSVRTCRLDSYLASQGVSRVSLVKIDVEGYEYRVLRGFARFLATTSVKPPIICEILPSAYRQPDYSLAAFHDYMNGFGYRAYGTFCPNKEVDIRRLDEATDVVFRRIG